jgi:hypothetical protein
MGIRDKFRQRHLGKMGWAGGESPETMSEPIVQSTSDSLENQQTGNAPARYDKLYKPGARPPRRNR